MYPVYPIYPPPHLPFPDPPVTSLHESCHIFLHRGQDRGLHLRTPPWTVPLRLVGWAWWRGSDIPPQCPLVLHQGIFQGQPSALPWLHGRMPRVGNNWKASRSKPSYLPLDLPRKCWIEAARSVIPDYFFHLVCLTLSAKYPPTGRLLMICLEAWCQGLARTPQRRISPGLWDLGCASQGVFISEPPWPTVRSWCMHPLGTTPRSSPVPGFL